WNSCEVVPDGFFFFSSRRRHTRFSRDWSSDVCSSDLDLVAPGVEVTVPFPKNGLGTVSGTAFAAAYVAGSVALLRSYQPQLTPRSEERRVGKECRSRWPPED